MGFKDVISGVGDFFKSAAGVVPAVGSAIGAIADPIFGIYDRINQNKTNEQNIAMQNAANAQNQANFDKSFAYQQDLNSQIMAREDSAMQRAVADAEAAGFSKWSVAGAGAAASPLSSASGGQSVAQGAKNTTQISQTAYGAEMANMRASIAQANATKKKSEYEERYYDGQLKHLYNEDRLNNFRTAMDFHFGMHDRHLADRQLKLEEDKQAEVAANNVRIIEETSRHNKAVEEETHRANVRSEQQKSQSLDIERANLLCRQAEAQLTSSWYAANEVRMKNDKAYQDAVIELEKQGIKQKYAQMIVSGVVDLAKTAFIGYGATHAMVPNVSGANKSTLYTPNTTSFGGVNYDRK